MDKSKILAVDDNTINLKLLNRVLRDAGYEVLIAQNGENAINMTLNNKPDLILLDVMMPDRDGFEVCELLKKNREVTDIPIIFLTAKNEAVDRVHGLALGAVDYITKPFEPVEVIARVRTHLRLRKLHQELLEKNKQLEKAYIDLQHKTEKINKDIKAAGFVQRQLLPQKISKIGPLHFSWNFVPSSHVAGDIFNILQLDKYHVALFIVDVSGHGVQSAMLAVSIYNFFTAGINTINLHDVIKKTHPLYYLLQPEKVAQALNTNFTMDKFDAYFTCIYLVINTKKLELKMINAGHPFPLILHGNNSFEFIKDGDIPIGMVNKAHFNVKKFKLNHGDKLILYTDGLYELTSNSEEELNQMTVAQLLRQSKGNLEQRFEHTINQILLKSGCKEFQDDVSLFGVEIL
jgi:sigma-B regulation protein RsbU (phosphoserine phosphatase)